MVDRQRRAAALDSREIIFETVQIGRVVKVTAIDPETLVEVSIQGPAGGDPAALEAAALRKLDYVLKRRKGET